MDLNIGAASPLVTPFALPSISPATHRKPSKATEVSSKIYTFEDSEAQPTPLTDITQKANISPYSPRENDKQKRSLSTNIATGISAIKTPHRAVKSRQFCCGNAQWQFHGLKSVRVKSPIYVSPHGKFTATDRRMASPKSCCYFSPVQYGAVTDQRKALMKEYYKRKKEVQKKYELMLDSLKDEEAAEIKCAALKARKENIGEEIDNIRHDYATTKNLLQQQKLVEEEELLLEYQAIVFGDKSGDL